MPGKELLHKAFKRSCPEIHKRRLTALMDVVQGGQTSLNLSQASIGRSLPGISKRKHKIKKVNRLCHNGQLLSECPKLYQAMSGYVLSYLTQDTELPIVIDLCFMKDDRQVQMLSAELVNKGRSIPLYREVFSEGQLKRRAPDFIARLKQCIGFNRKVIIIMDAGFFEDWFKAIEAAGWYWIARVRMGRSMYLAEKQAWLSYSDYISSVGRRVKTHTDVLLTKKHKHACRLVSVKKAAKGRHCITTRKKISRGSASASYNKASKEPWVLASNLPTSVSARKIIKFYEKRMQIEESFRDLKSHRFGLGGHYISSSSISVWAISMLVASILQVILLIIGLCAREQGMQRIFQANTSYDKRVFSDIYLAKLVIQHGYLKKIKIKTDMLTEFIGQGVYQIG